MFKFWSNEQLLAEREKYSQYLRNTLAENTSRMRAFAEGYARRIDSINIELEFRRWKADKEKK